MTTTLERWHAECNRAVADAHAERMAQFGMRRIGEPAPAGVAPLVDPLRGRAVWAWQPGRLSPEGAAARLVRAGFGGTRLHLGHLSLARDIASLQRQGMAAVLFTRTVGESGAAEDLAHAIAEFGGDGPQVVDADAPAVRAFEDRALSTVPLRRLAQIYGWTGETSLSRLRDAGMMMAFLMFGFEDQSSVALLDVNQVPHTALARTIATRRGAALPVTAYRRLLPPLTGPGRRMSVHSPRATLFLDDDTEEARRKFLTAATGGRATAAQQRAHGGDPARCPVFEMIELLCTPERAEAALERCRSGEMLCRPCKASHVDEVLSGIRRHRPVMTPRRATTAGPSPAATVAINASARSLYRPPPRDPTRLEEMIADYTGVNPDQVVVGNGATEVLDWVFAEQVSTADFVLAGEPTFELYEHLARRHGLPYRTITWHETSGTHRLADFRTALDGGTNAICVVDSPHSLSGVATPLAEILDALAPVLRSGMKLVIDNVYGEYMSRPMALTAEFVEQYDALVVCRSLSKAHCLLGARVGYAITSAAHAARLRRRRLPYGINALSAAAAGAALADHRTLARNVAASRDARAVLTRRLDEMGLRYLPTDANFMLIDLGDRRDQILDVLRARGLRYRDGGRWRLPSMIQVHVIDEAGIWALTDALAQV